MNARNPVRVALALAIALAGILTGVTHAAPPRTVRGSYDVNANPGAPAFATGDNGVCSSRIDVPTTRDVHPFTAPFAGWLHVSLNGLTGDWDLGLANASGEVFAWASTQFYVVGDREQLDYYLARGQHVSLVACNYTGAPQAHVDYQLVAGPAWARPSVRHRTATEKLGYLSPAAGVATGWKLCYVGEGVGCVATEPPSWARYVSVKIEDALGLPVAAFFYQYYGDTAHANVGFCGKTDAPFAITPQSDWLGVVVVNGPCADGTPAQATRGKVVLTFMSHRR